MGVEAGKKKVCVVTKIEFHGLTEPICDHTNHTKGRLFLERIWLFKPPKLPFIMFYYCFLSLRAITAY